MIKKVFFILERCAQEKTDPGDGKPTYFFVWPHSNYIYYTECIKLIDIKIYLAQHQIYNAFVYQKLVTFRTHISLDLI